MLLLQLVSLELLNKQTTCQHNSLSDPKSTDAVNMSLHQASVKKYKKVLHKVCIFFIRCCIKDNLRGTHTLLLFLSLCCWEVMNYLDSTEYPAGTTFSQERLRQITPEDLVRYLNYEVYGNETPADDNEAQIRSSTVEFWKKALSYFMPNRMMVWNEIASVGNPTRSALVNQLIKVMKRKEVCGQGQSSRAWRPLNDNKAITKQEG